MAYEGLKAFRNDKAVHRFIASPSKLFFAIVAAGC